MTEDEDPLTFAVRLRTHPALRVTAAAKMRDAVTAASSYGGKRVQTHYFRTDADWLRGNIDAASALIKASAAHGGRVDERPVDGRYVFYEVPHDLVINFLSDYRFHEKSPENDVDLIKGYIRKRVSAAGSLQRWNIAIVGSPQGEGFTFTPGVTVGRNTRARLAVTSPTPGFADIKTLMSRRDAGVDLSGDVGKLTDKAIMELRQSEFPDTGLLVLYPIDKFSAPSPSKKLRDPLNAEEHVIGVGLVFPKPANGDSTVEKYISANLANVRIEEEDYSLLDSEEA